jgi:hypothetical protein
MGVKVSNVKEAKTLEVKIDAGDVGYTVQFRFDDDKATNAKVSVDGINWFSVDVLHKAIGAFIERYPFEFAEE